ncbi:MAG TPA: DUF3097 domain-containing protein [Dermatophilaceae bacterium]|nr:DUF3097 domain-containing protein [Dermatophilaceae bacterium]
MPRVTDRYGEDVLAGQWRQQRRPAAAAVAADPGLVVEDVETGWCGAVVRVEKAGGMHVVHLEDRRGRTKGFPLGPGFLLDGAPVVLTAPVPSPAPDRPGGSTARTASGSFAVRGGRARVATASRLFVEGRHDAELVEQVWGADLRVEGVVVELLEGVDHLGEAVAQFRPGPGRRMGVLVDHLVPGSKETRLVQQVTGTGDRAAYLKVLGHPYVDVWQSVRPQRLGLDAWPDVPRGRSWKHGVLEALGWPARTQADVAEGWHRILGRVRTYADLEPALLARVEELIDFVTQA